MILHATLEEVEPGLFRADYPGEMNGSDDPKGGQLPGSAYCHQPGQCTGLGRGDGGASGLRTGGVALITQTRLHLRPAVCSQYQR